MQLFTVGALVMRRINENRKKYKSNEQPVKCDILMPKKHLNLDILCILQNYYKKFVLNKPCIDHKFLRKDQITKVTYDRKLPKEAELDVYVNLREVVVKNIDCVDLRIFANLKIRRLTIVNIGRVCASETLDIVELKLCHSVIDMQNLKKLINTNTLKCLTFINLRIAKNNKMDVTSNHTIENCFSDSEEVFAQYEYELQTDRERECMSMETELISSTLTSAINNIALKKLTCIHTDIDIKHILSLKFFENLSKFTYVCGSRVICTSQTTGIWTYFKGSYYKQMDFAGFEALHVCSTEIFERGYNLQYVKSITIVGCMMCEKVVNNICTSCTQAIEYAFVNCNFSDTSFYRLVRLVCDRAKYMNFHKSVLPLDAQEYLQKSVKNCKTVFWDKNIKIRRRRV